MLKKARKEQNLGVNYSLGMWGDRIASVKSASFNSSPLPIKQWLGEGRA